MVTAPKRREVFPLIPQYRQAKEAKAIARIDTRRSGIMIFTSVKTAPKTGPLWLVRSLNKERYVPAATVAKKRASRTARWILALGEVSFFTASFIIGRPSL